MKFEVQKSVLISGIFDCYKIADSGPNINPILTNLQLNALSDGTVTCIATDAAASVHSTFKSDVSKGGKATISAKLFYNIVSSMSGDSVTIEKVDNQVIIISQKAKFELNAMRDEDFPSIYIPAADAFSSFEPIVLSEIIDKTIFSVSNDDAKQHLTGIFMVCKDKIAIAVSTDGHRLTLSEYAYEGEFTLPAGIIIPKKAAKEIKRLADTNPDGIMLAYIQEKKMLAVKAGVTIMTVRIIDSKFPPYEQVIPDYKENVMVVPKSQMQASLKRIQLISEGSESGTILTLGKDLLKLTSTDVSKGKAFEEIEVDYQGEEFTIAFNIKFLDQILGKIEGPELKMTFGGAKAAALVTPVDSTSFVAVIMPLKLSD